MLAGSHSSGCCEREWGGGGVRGGVGGGNGRWEWEVGKRWEKRWEKRCGERKVCVKVSSIEVRRECAGWRYVG